MCAEEAEAEPAGAGRWLARKADTKHKEQTLSLVLRECEKMVPT